MISFPLFLVFMLFAIPAIHDGRKFIMAVPLIIAMVINFTGAIA